MSTLRSKESNTEGGIFATGVKVVLVSFEVKVELCLVLGFPEFDLFEKFDLSVFKTLVMVHVSTRSSSEQINSFHSLVFWNFEKKV